MLDEITIIGIVRDLTHTEEQVGPGGAEKGESMISRRNFLSLLPVVPPVCKALVAHNAEWDQFAADLSRALSSLEKGHFLIVETKGDQYYVQFAGGGSLRYARGIGLQRLFKRGEETLAQGMHEATAIGMERAHYHPRPNE